MITIDKYHKHRIYGGVNTVTIVKVPVEGLGPFINLSKRKLMTGYETVIDKFKYFVENTLYRERERERRV